MQAVTFNIRLEVALRFGHNVDSGEAFRRGLGRDGTLLATIHIAVEDIHEHDTILSNPWRPLF